jgi:hypothetical protein
MNAVTPIKTDLDETRVDVNAVGIQFHFIALLHKSVCYISIQNGPKQGDGLLS